MIPSRATSGIYDNDLLTEDDLVGGRYSVTRS
jgi:hypothetical protein